jgi:polyisoprenoid-binding protein YceI
MKSVKFSFCVLAFVAMMPCAVGQKYVTDVTFVSFFSQATIENITATNKKTVGIFNPSNADIAFSVPIQEFKFAKSLMQEHFNEKYMESDKYPKSTFQGKISDFNMEATGVQDVKASGKLTIHGVTNNIDVPGTIEKAGEKLLMKSKFKVKLQDYKIAIPQLLWQNIAEEVEVTLEFAFKPQ